MNDILIPGTLSGNLYPSWAVQAVDTMLENAKKRGMWPTIDMIVDVWLKKHPEEALRVKAAVREANINAMDTHGSNEKTRQGKMSLRRLLEMPTEIDAILDLMYREEIKQYKGGRRGFLQDFAKRYAIFRVPDKV